MGTIDGSLPGAITSRVTSMTAPSARAVTACTIGNAYGGFPSNLIFPIARFPLLLRLASHWAALKQLRKLADGRHYFQVKRGCRSPASLAAALLPRAAM